MHIYIQIGYFPRNVYDFNRSEKTKSAHDDYNITCNG